MVKKDYLLVQGIKNQSPFHVFFTKETDGSMRHSKQKVSGPRGPPPAAGSAPLPVCGREPAGKGCLGFRV